MFVDSRPRHAARIMDVRSFMFCGEQTVNGCVEVGKEVKALEFTGTDTFAAKYHDATPTL